MACRSVITVSDGEVNGNDLENGDSVATTTTTPTPPMVSVDIEVKAHDSNAHNAADELMQPDEIKEELPDFDTTLEPMQAADAVAVPGSSNNWANWVRVYKWVLHEADDGDFAHCLYCDVRLRVHNGDALNQHEISLYHQERMRNYLSFIEAEQQAESREAIAAVYQCQDQERKMAKLKELRSSFSKALSKFNWESWYSEHNWLRRENNDGTIGYCEVCKLAVNVEFKSLRVRHERSAQHLDNVKNYYNQIDNADEQETDGRRSTRRNQIESDQRQSAELDDRSVVELLPHTGADEPKLRCKLCNVTMIRRHFPRHVKCLNHTDNLKRLQFGKSGKTEGQHNITIKQENGHESPWAKYAKMHPWLTSDPTDATQSYCSICEKRFMYGGSAIKRQIHENSNDHKYNDHLKKRRSAAATSADSPFVQENQLTADSDLAWLQRSADLPNFNVCNYCNLIFGAHITPAAHEADNSHRFSHEQHTKMVNTMKNGQRISWMCFSRNNHIVFCKFCSQRLPSSDARFHHGESAEHKEAEKRYLESYRQRLVEQNENTNTGAFEPAPVNATVTNTNLKIESDPDIDDDDDDDDEIDEDGDALTDGEIAYKPTPSSIQGKILVWKKNLPWLSYKRSETRDNYGFCTVCEMPLFVPTYKVAKNHQRSGKHMRLQRYQKRSDGAAHQQPGKYAGFLSTMQKVFNWIQPYPDNPDCCVCTVCSLRVSLKPSKLRKHNASRYHRALAGNLSVKDEVDGDLGVERDEHASAGFLNSTHNATATASNLPTAESILNGIAKLAAILPHQNCCHAFGTAGGEPPNPIDTYIEYLSKSFKSMPPHIFLYAKSKLGPILQECEERQLREQQSHVEQMDNGDIPEPEHTGNDTLTNETVMGSESENVPPATVPTAAAAALQLRPNYAVAATASNNNAAASSSTAVHAVPPIKHSGPPVTTRVAPFANNAVTSSAVAAVHHQNSRPIMNNSYANPKYHYVSNSQQISPGGPVRFSHAANGHANSTPYNGVRRQQTLRVTRAVSPTTGRETVKYALLRSTPAGQAPQAQHVDRKEIIRCVPVSALTGDHVARNHAPPRLSQHGMVMQSNMRHENGNQSMPKLQPGTKLIRINTGGQSKLVSVPADIK